jgi:eukaryotic-like serine/threonine-protein kinase
VIGQTLSHYRIVNRIGTGGMGEVYLAEDTRLGRKLAIKFLPAQFTQDADRVRRFEQEARAASALNHPNIITIYEIGQHERGHYIATEFIEGDTLRQRLNRGGLNLSETLDLATQCLSALQAAHQAGIIHRDIKPENIMLRPDGYVKLLDFGLAKLTQAEADTGDLEGPTRSLFETQPGMVMGTVAYMSPEQARGQKMDGRTDIFSFGVVLYEMLTGQRPFAGATTSDIIAALLTQEPARLSQRLAGAPGELEQIVARMLAKDLARRYQTAQELLADLKRVKARVELSADEEATTRALAEPQAAAPSFETNLSAPVSYETTHGTMAQFGAATGAPTNVITQNAVAATVSLSAAPTPRRKPLLAAGAALAVLLTALAGYLFYQQRASRVDSIAVLPFKSAAPSSGYLSEALTEQLIDTLSQIPELNIVARSSILRYKGQETDPVKLGEELNVAAVLLGETVQRGEDILVKTELVSTQNRRRIWGENYVRKLTDLLTLSTDVARGIGQKLGLSLEQLPAAIAQAGTKDQEAYRLYLEANYYFNQGTPEALHKADELYEAAVARDKSFAAAAAGCAACHAAGSDRITPEQAMLKARNAAEFALKNDPQSVDAHLTLAKVKLRYDWNFAEAEALFKRAIELDRKHAEAHQRYAEFLALLGRHKEAMSEIWTARKLDPHSLPINTDIGTLSYYAADFPHAAEHFQKSLKLDAAFAAAHLGLGLVNEQQGRAPDAVNELLQAKLLMHEPQTYLNGLKQALPRAGCSPFGKPSCSICRPKPKSITLPPRQSPPCTRGWAIRNRRWQH